MTPAHRKWQGKGNLPPKPDHGLGKWSYNKKCASKRVYKTICGYKRLLEKNPDSSPVSWYKNLDVFVEGIKNKLSSNEELKLDPPVIVAKFKEKDDKTNDFIFRPICLYKDLETKIILTLSYQYIVKYFDKYFHSNMLFMRGTEKVGGEYRTKNFLDAIDKVRAYREKNKNCNIYVGECDIQKFYDIFNHDVILECFEDLFNAAKSEHKFDDSLLNPLRRVLRAYLDSFDFSSVVFALNQDPGFWQNEKRRRSKNKSSVPVCRFKWVKEKDFLNCYSEEEFIRLRDGKKLGIPQGGALSGIIVNVVMRLVDKPIVDEQDSQRLFIRYCDDILLMHTDKEKCRQYLDTYYNQLIKYKLIPHLRKDVSSVKKGSKTKLDFWHAKSKNVYRWGSGKGDASDWVAFVGYEMRSTGEIRIRKDKIDGEYKKIARSYHNVVDAKAVSEARENKAVLTEEQQIKLMERMAKLPEHFKDYEKAGANKYTFSQARRLDKYLYLKRLQAAKIIGCANPSSIVGSFRTYSEVVEEKENSRS